MRILDFIIYYTTIYFKKNSYLLTWSTALERACYATTLATIFWTMTFWEIVNDYILKKKNHDLPAVLLIIVGICASLLYQYIYINRNRYEFIISDNYKRFQIEEKNGILTVIVFNIISFIIPFAIAISIGITGSR